MVSRLFSHTRRSTATRSQKNRRRTLHLENLESRQLLAVVTTLANSGTGSLRSAIQSGDPQVTFAISGTIDLTTQLSINRSIDIDAAGQNITIRNVTVGQRVFNVVQGTSAIRNVTITGGQITDAASIQVGGAIRLNAATLTLENTIVEDSFGGNGGGIGVTANGTLNLVNSTVRNNFARNQGGGISVAGNSTINVENSIIESNQAGQESTDQFLRIGGGIAVFANAFIRDSIIRNNECETPLGLAQLGWGGGVGVFETSGTVLIENTEISGNIADRGGGIAVRLSTITVRGSNIADNTSFFNGGGIRVMRVPAGPAVVNVENTTFKGNDADGGGGIGASVYLDSEVSTSTLNVSGSTFEQNTSLYDGGGIEAFGTISTITNSTVVNNTGDREGGGIWNSFDATFDGSFAMEYATITGNSAQKAGGFFSGEDGTIRMDNSLLSGNTAVSGTAPDLYDPTYYYGNSILQAEYNLVESTYGHLLVNGVDGNIIGQTPQLGPLADNGGPTHTRMLLPGPGVDGADPSSTVVVDQRGYSRPGANSMRDVGAVESDGTPTTFNLDFNNDGQYNCDDMNMLESAIDAGSPIATFDVNQDGALTSADVYAWLTEAGELRFGAGRPFLQGDANLDGSVDGSDFGIWNSGKFTAAATWCQADFNQDGGVDGSDFGIWNSNKFNASDAGRPSDGQQVLRRQSDARRSNGKMIMRQAEAYPDWESSMQLPTAAVETAPDRIASLRQRITADVVSLNNEVVVRTPMAAAPAIAVTLRADISSSARTTKASDAARESIFGAQAEDEWCAIR